MLYVRIRAKGVIKLKDQEPRIIFGPADEHNKLLLKWSSPTHWQGLIEIDGKEIEVFANKEAIEIADQVLSKSGTAYENQGQYARDLASILYHTAAGGNQP